MKFSPTLLVISVAVCAGVMFYNNAAKAKDESLSTMVVGSQIPEAWGLFQILEFEAQVILIDATGDQSLAERPTMALIGETIRIGSKQHAFAVIPTQEEGVPTVTRPHLAGETVEISRDGAYTVIILDLDSAAIPRPVAVSFIVKARKDNLDAVVQKFRQRQERRPDPSLSIPPNGVSI